jgi:hypothetical protein
MIGRHHRIALLTACCLGTACASGAAAPGSPGAEPEAEDDVFALATGSWDRVRGDSTCAAGSHAISFSPDRREMVLTYPASGDTVAPSVFRYRILGWGPEILPPARYVIRGAIEGETRRTPSGERVIWDLIMATPHSYYWHRTDWPLDAVAAPAVRCDGDRPVGPWDSPSSEPRQGSQARARVGGAGSSSADSDASGAPLARSFVPAGRLVHRALR